MNSFLRLLVSLFIGLAFAHGAEPRHIVLMIGEDEYRTAETLPEFAEKELKPRGYRVSIVHADAADKNQFPGIVAALRDADLLVLSVRRRSPPQEQLDTVRAHVRAGKALIGIRTASHAFALRGKAKPTDPALATWPSFDSEVLGGNYTNHHGNDKAATLARAPGAEAHPILREVKVEELKTRGSLYMVSPLEAGTTPLLIGTVADAKPEPVAWTRIAPGAANRVFYTSLGHPDDFQNAEFRRLLVNAIAWTLEK